MDFFTHEPNYDEAFLSQSHVRLNSDAFDHTKFDTPRPGCNNCTENCKKPTQLKIRGIIHDAYMGRELNFNAM